MNYAAILFDMDGTLLETGPLWSRATRIALDTHHIELTEEEHFSLGGVLLEHLLADKGYTLDIIESVYRARDAALGPVMREEASWVDGAEEFLQSLKIPKGIVTSAHKNIFAHVNHRLRLDEIVDTIVVADDVLPDYKPHPKGLFLACERLTVNPADCVYIGDQSCDIEAAKNAGMTGILMRGTFTPPDLQHETSVNDFASLKRTLESR